MVFIYFFAKLKICIKLGNKSMVNIAYALCTIYIYIVTINGYAIIVFGAL